MQLSFARAAASRSYLSVRRAMRLAACLVIGAAVPLSAHAATHTVTITGSSYVPRNLVVNEGDTVRWVWQSDNHNVVSGVPFVPTGAFESPLQNTGGLYEFRFDRQLLNAYPVALNRYDYYCDPHAAMGMTGSVRVVRGQKNFAAALAGWQVVPETSSTRTGTCTATLSANEASFTIACTHNVPNGTRMTLRRGFYGSEGDVICSFGGGGSISGSCPLSSPDIDRLLDAELYFELESPGFPQGEIRGQLVKTGDSGTLSGTVRNPNGGGVAGALVTDGTIQATTDANGAYVLPNVPNGVVRLTATAAGLNLAPLRGVSPLVVNGADLALRDFSIVPQRSCGTDTDLDGVCDKAELIDLSDPDDPGSFRSHLDLPLYGLWNGFLSMTNILELVNRTAQDQTVSVLFHNIQGQMVRKVDLVLRALEQRDLILNDFAEFQRDSYGLIVVTLPQGAQNGEIVDGRMSYYRSAGSAFEFAFSVPLAPPSYGRSSVAFNTFQPSLQAGQGNYLVTQWLSIVNLDTTAAKSYTVYRFDERGVLLTSAVYSVAPFGRLDIEGGHVSPGPSKVGQHVVIPHDVVAPYIVQLFRYGTNAGPGAVPTGYEFALPILSRAGNGRAQRVPVSTGGGAENWVELVNTRESPTPVTIEFFGNNGALLGGESFQLGAFAQRHFNAGAVLGPNASGSARITPGAANAVVGQSMFYFRSATGAVSSMYGTPLREPLGSPLIGSYNLFLGMYNWLKLTNLRSTESRVTVSVIDSSLSPHEIQVVMPPLGGADLGIHEGATFGTVPNSYGVFSVEDHGSGDVSAELLRVHPVPGGSFDFAIPTAVR